MSNTPDHNESARRTPPAEAPASVAQAEPASAPCRRTTDADEPMGGDPPCWAHLFEEDDLSTSDR